MKREKSSTHFLIRPHTIMPLTGYANYIFRFLSDLYPIVLYVNATHIQLLDFTSHAHHFMTLHNNVSGLKNVMRVNGLRVPSRHCSSWYMFYYSSIFHIFLAAHVFPDSRFNLKSLALRLIRLVSFLLFLKEG